MIKDTFPILGEAYELKEYYRAFNKTATYEEAVVKYDDIVRYFKTQEFHSTTNSRQFW